MWMLLKGMTTMLHVILLTNFLCYVNLFSRALNWVWFECFYCRLVFTMCRVILRFAKEFSPCALCNFYCYLLLLFVFSPCWFQISYSQDLNWRGMDSAGFQNLLSHHKDLQTSCHPLHSTFIVPLPTLMLKQLFLTFIGIYWLIHSILLASQSDAHTIAPHRDPIHPYPIHI